MCKCIKTRGLWESGKYIPQRTRLGLGLLGLSILVKIDTGAGVPPGKGTNGRVTNASSTNARAKRHLKNTQKTETDENREGRIHIDLHMIAVT